MIRAVRPGDGASICGIYNHYIANTVVTFATEPETVEAMGEAIAAADDRHPWLVWVEDGAVLGYALAGAWKSRCAYRYSVETTIYLDPAAAGRGIGTRLYAELLERVRAAGHHSALGGIALPNPASVALHEKLGFRQVGRFVQVGRKFGRWVDVGYWQRIFAP